MDILYFTIITPHSGFVEGPLKKTDFNLKSWIIMGFIIHGCITYYLVNNLFVAAAIKKLTDKDTKAKFNTEFLVPIKRLIRLTLVIVIGALIGLVIFAMGKLL
ncbi:hypothetical protein [Mucilaginibacter gracilis]|uniref:hypothetical protein n=1 Tax=Mucilaginibacter gracilis TaxID=423350 RepID=UPI0011C3EE1D|nr:hypothetical protein [Mucilaginibacter gracilis]